MVRGIEKFKEYFADYDGNYVIIGGTACDILEENAGQQPRATKDIDIILIVEALSIDFVKQFWKFVKDGRYNPCQQSSEKQQHFRFSNPKYETFPKQIELFSRKPNILYIPDDVILIPIPVDEDLSSLSAILMNDLYYLFTIEHSIIDDTVRLADIESLIVLKAKAFLDLNERRLKGEIIDSKKINKHKNDIFRLATLLSDTIFILPDAIFDDFTFFCRSIMNILPEDSFFANTMGLNTTAKEVFDRLCKYFNIEII